jgi:nucleotide-binding universal stress UspA family protein
MEGDAHVRHPIVAGADGSPQSRAVASVAARLARGLGRSLILAHAASDPSTFRFPDAGERGRQRARAIEQGFALLKSIGSTLPDAVRQTAVVLGSPDEALAAFCHQEQAELLVVGSRGRGRLAAALLGSHVSAGPCPVVVVPPAAADRFLAPARPGGSVVCGIDGSVEAVRAVRVGANVACVWGSSSCRCTSISATRGMGRRPPTRSCSTSKPAILSRGFAGAP